MKINDNSINVLLIEDDQIDIKNIKYGFKKFAIQNNLIIAEDGLEALDKLYGREGQEKITPPPKLILADINMPRMNAFEFLRELKKDASLADIPIILVTTSDSKFDRQAAEEFAVDKYYVKPLKFAEFFPVYSEIIESP